ncbi:SAM-dependent methyltransferase [Campylobacter sp. MIT 99-7217]|uniref:class I SAM-dependent methyltransferase n=1 Tax=Campylobacter sp. MIT 99-7217 TaxID=535091 RepID=UPI001159AD8B|nr:rRNA adenine N-6-methyltransferase family protein [Campylobacter sp. MIT 99-7217]TQR31928.1 SAM-dependent methyltransferase [Campylobacter sp. MIT 99-7217]
MFIYQYIKHPKRVGALCSSSQKLGLVITKDLNLKKASNIVEIGSGTGAFTRHILKQKQENTNFFAVEINQTMAINLVKKVGKIDIEVGDAKSLKQMLERRNMPHANLIISGIPWAMLKDIEQERLLQVIYESLAENGEFRTFAYILPTLKAKNFRQKLFKLFKEVQISKTIWQNIPPAFVYFCKK